MKLSHFAFLAAGPLATPAPDELAKNAHWSWKGTGEVLLIIGLAVVFGLLFFGWAYFVRKRRPNDPHRQVIEAGSTNHDGEPAGEGRHHHGRRRRHRHRHGSHGHRNPTLQETGGLPVPRPEDQPPPI